MQKLSFLFVLALSLLVSHSSFAGDLATMVQGRYKVANRSCFGNPYGSLAAIGVSGSLLKFVVQGPQPFSVKMFEGNQKGTLPNGQTFERGGVLFGNGFAYGETVRQGPLIVSRVEYTLLWQNGELSIKRVTRITHDHAEAAYCDLVRAQ